MKLVRALILVASASLFVIGLACSKTNSFKIMKMPSGSQYKVIGVGVVKSPLVRDDMAFVFAYQSDHSLSDEPSIQSEVLELQGYVVLNANNQNLNHAILEIHDSPSGFLGLSKNMGYIYERNLDGSWHRSGDTTIVPMAKPVPSKTGA